MASTNFQKNFIQDYNFGGVSYTPPANYYLGMSSTSISVNGSNVTEPTSGSYARVLIPNTKGYWTYSSSGCVVNSGPVTFVQSSGSWATMVDIALFDSLTSGSVRYYTTLPSPITVAVNTTVSFSASSINISQT